MAILKILEYPDERLHKVAASISVITDEIRMLVQDMAETMYAVSGIGLAATQVDVHQRLIIIDVSDTRDQLHVFINPEIIASSGESDCQEGCLSVPGIFERIKRAENITIRAMGLEGNLFELDAGGIFAVCIQHEIDHLMGRVFIEHLSQLKQSRIRSKLKKRQRDVKP